MAHFIEKVPQKDSDWIWLIILTKDSDRIWLLKKRIVQCFAKSYPPAVTVVGVRAGKSTLTTSNAEVCVVSFYGS